MDPEKTFCPDRGCRSVRIAPGLPETSQKLLSGPPQFFAKNCPELAKSGMKLRLTNACILKKRSPTRLFQENYFFVRIGTPTTLLLEILCTQLQLSWNIGQPTIEKIISGPLYLLLLHTSCSTTSESRHRTMHLIEPRSRVFPALYHHSCSWCDGYGYGDGPSDDPVVVCNRWGC